VKRMILLGSCGIASMGLIPLTRLRLPLQESGPEAGHEKRRWRVNPFLLRFLPSMALWTAVLAAFAPFANVYLAKDLHLSMARIGLIFSVSQVLQLCVGQVTPWLFRRLGLVRGIVATQVATGAAMGLLAIVSDPRLAVALYLSFTASQWMSSPGLYNLLMSRVPDAERSQAAAITLFSNALLQSFATAGAGVLFAAFGYPRVLAGIAALALAAATLFGVVFAPAARGLTAEEEAP